LDPKKRYFGKYKDLIKEKLGDLPKKSDHPLTLLFSIGGAGAQKEIGFKIIKGLKKKIKKGEIKIIISVGVRKKIRDYFFQKIKELKTEREIEIIFEEKIEDYLKKFNQALNKTDILWTKPSELSFYSALGLPIIISPPIGSQEEFNKRYLLKSGFGMIQERPEYAEQWLFDWLNEGYLAEAAMEGFIEGEKLGVFKIEKIISK
jgi:UDP-N-acetylglucosamine:LPS N-acetylglucosamine transferase